MRSSAAKVALAFHELKPGLASMKVYQRCSFQSDEQLFVLVEPGGGREPLGSRKVSFMYGVELL